MTIRLSVLIAGMLAMIGCTAAPPYGASEVAKRAPILGVVVDENQRVVDVWSGGAAEAVGLLVGDRLIDLTWIPSSTSVPTTTSIPSESAEQASPLIIQDRAVVTTIAPIPAPTIPPEQYIETGSVPFTDSVGIINLVALGLALRLRVERAGEILEMTIVPNRSIFRALAPGESTPTPASSMFFYY